MQYQEIEIFNSKYKIKANLKIPSNGNSKLGIILAHGGIVNRQSLIRKGNSLGDYLCKELNAYVISPDFLGDTIHYNDQSYENFSEILNITSEFFVEKYGLKNLLGFGHSLGSFVLADSLVTNNYLNSIVTYGGPILEFFGSRQNNFISYLINYLTAYNYSINIRNMIRYIFDKETCIYLENVMLKDGEYCSNNYVFDFTSSVFKYFKEMADHYLASIKNWNKPALLLFGANDGVTKKTVTAYRNKQLGNNIQMMEIPNSSHITPCMDSMYQISKLSPMVDFFEGVLLKYRLNYVSKSIL